MFLRPAACVLSLFLFSMLLSPMAAQESALKDDVSKPLAERADILVITNADLSASWQEFATWKTATARPTKVVTTESIEKDFEGDDLQAKIRACCLKHINEMNTKWVVLGGDSSGDGGIVPDRDTDHSECQMLSYDNIPTDLYYISEKDWDANDDGRYGVFSDDLEAVSYYNPKATIGRVPVRTAEDVSAYVQKVIQYESGYPVGDFAKRMVYTCPVEAAYPKLGTSIKEVTEAWDTGYICRFFANETAWDDTQKGDHELVPSNWIELINNRRASKMHIHGHGLLDLWVLENDETVKQDSVAKLTNERAYPVITTVSCLTGQYDDKKDPCIAESMIRQPLAGAIAILAPSREGVPFMMSSNDFRLMMTEGKMDGTTSAYTSFWKYALTEDITIGEAFRKVKMEYEDNARQNDGFHMCQCELNLLGDPSIRVHSAPPKNFQQIRVRRSNNKVRVRNAGDAIVCVWDGNSDFHQIESVDRKSASVELASDADHYHVAVMAPGHNIFYKPPVKPKTAAKEPESESTEIAKADSKPESSSAQTESDANGRTHAQFRAYVAEKMAGIPDEQLDKIVKAVDSNDDGVISDQEFEKRREAIREAFSDDDGQ